MPDDQRSRHDLVGGSVRLRVIDGGGERPPSSEASFCQDPDLGRVEADGGSSRIRWSVARV